MEKSTTKVCPLCKRDIPCSLMERHHIKTREVDRFDVVPICDACHKTIHSLFSNRQIKEGLNSIEALLANEQFVRALKFIKKQAPTSKIHVKKAKSRKRR